MVVIFLEEAVTALGTKVVEDLRTSEPREGNRFKTFIVCREIVGDVVGFKYESRRVKCADEFEGYFVYIILVG